MNRLFLALREHFSNDCISGEIMSIVHHFWHPTHKDTNKECKQSTSRPRAKRSQPPAAASCFTLLKANLSSVQLLSFSFNPDFKVQQRDDVQSSGSFVDFSARFSSTGALKRQTLLCSAASLISVCYSFRLSGSFSAPTGWDLLGHFQLCHPNIKHKRLKRSSQTTACRAKALALLNTTASLCIKGAVKSPPDPDSGCPVQRSGTCRGPWMSLWWDWALRRPSFISRPGLCLHLGPETHGDTKPQLPQETDFYTTPSIHFPFRKPNRNKLLVCWCTVTVLFLLSLFCVKDFLLAS